MSLTENDKEEIKDLIREVFEEKWPKIIDSASISVGTYTNMFDNWNEKSICLCSRDIINTIELAPEDFVLKADFKLKDDTILKKGKRYFTYDEAMALEEELFKPNGWRLPTTREFMLLHATYGVDENGKNDAKAFYEVLNLEPQGYIRSNGMDEYNKNPENFEKNGGTVLNRATDGYWWSRNASSATDANCLSTDISHLGGVYARDSNYRGCGYSVRCVIYEEEEE